MKNLNKPKNYNAYGRQQRLCFTAYFLSAAFHPIHALFTLWQDHFKSGILQTRKGVQRVLLRLFLSLPRREQKREREIQ
jgi:hypothetical protein